MNKDIRLLLSFRNHPKTKKLKHKLGAEGVLSFIWLLMFTAESKSEGLLDGMDVIDIALAADWEGEPEAFVSFLADVRLLDFDGETYLIHEWKQHNPWAAHARQRSEHGRKAANARWEKNYGATVDGTENQEVTREHDASGIDGQCTEHEGAMRGASMSNAPTPTPTPTPKEHGSSAKPTNRADYPDDFEEAWKTYPKRNGSNPKKAAYSAYKQRLKEGATHEELLLGVQRYTVWSDVTDKTGTETVMQARRFFGPGREWENEWQSPDKPLKLPRDNRTLWKIRTDLGMPFEYEDLDECHREIRSRLRQHPEKRSLIEGMV